MNNLSLVSGVRVLVASFVAAAGLFASAPQVHGTTQTRGAVTCNINVVGTYNCGNKANYMTCVTNYTKCKSLSGPKDKICSMNTVTSCKVDTECMLQTDYSWSSECVPTGYGASIPSGTPSNSSPRRSQVQ
jgi:hypothetical protein